MFFGLCDGGDDRTHARQNQLLQLPLSTVGESIFVPETPPSLRSIKEPLAPMPAPEFPTATEAFDDPAALCSACAST